MTPDERKEAKRHARDALRTFRRSFEPLLNRPEAARRLGVTGKDIENWENEISLPPMDILVKLMKFGFPKEMVPLNISANEEQVGELIYLLRELDETQDKLAAAVAEAQERWRKVKKLVFN